MPIYEYRCDDCGFQKEHLQKLADKPLSDCPDCGKATYRKLLTAAGFHLKGSGWYATDFKGTKPAAKTEKAEKTETKTEAETPAKAPAASSSADASAACST